MWLFKVGRVGLVGSVALLAGANCLGSDPLRPHVPPLVRVLSPVDTEYDQDGDKLADLVVLWQAPAGSVDYRHVQVHSVEGLNGSATPATNLIGVWRLERLDSLGLTLHETRDNLLHPGLNHLVLSVPDTTGNVRLDTISFALPFAAFIKTIPSGLTMGVQPAYGVTICADHHLYMTAGISLVVFDPDSLSVLKVVGDPAAPDALVTPLCVAGDSTLYVTLRVERFDRPSMTWLPSVSGSFGSDGIVQSRLNPDTLYVGEQLDGTVGVIERTQDTRVGQLLTPSQPAQEYDLSLAMMPGDTKLYVTRSQQGGILVVDPTRDSILAHIPVGGPEYAAQGNFGDTQSLTLSRDSHHLYAAVDAGLPLGVVDIDTQRDSVVRNLPLFDYYCVGLGLSPDESRMFVVTQDNGAPSQNVLVDVINWTVLATFPRPRASGETRFDRAVAFHPSGKLIFVTHNVDVDVYLNRE